jgi:hypothetical protein
LTLPIPIDQLDPHAKINRPPGAIFNYEIGENIMRMSYRQLVTRFGTPLKTILLARGERCAYYDVVGDARGWVFCFRRGKMVSAVGNQTPPGAIDAAEEEG